MFKFDGKKLKEAREVKQMSQTALGAKLGTSFSTIARLENDERANPTILTLGLICHYLEIPITDLLTTSSLADAQKPTVAAQQWQDKKAKAKSSPGKRKPAGAAK
jgi:transcriptional regulator with XRE-family HTH domain